MALAVAAGLSVGAAVAYLLASDPDPKDTDAAERKRGQAARSPAGPGRDGRLRGSAAAEAPESTAELPRGGSAPPQEIADLREAAGQAGCQLRAFEATSREHSSDLTEVVRYRSRPPAAGRHFEIPAEDGLYERAPDVKELVHSLEHGRVVVWFRADLPRARRMSLRALFDEDPFQMILTPDPSGMRYAVAATAWNGDPAPNGTGHLLGCPEFGAGAFDALRAFRDRHRGNGPEPVP